MTAPLNPSGENSNVRLVTVPGTGASAPEKSAVEQASDLARSNMEKYGNPLGAARTGDGKFTQGTVKPVAEPVDGGVDPAAPRGGNERPAGDQPLANTEQPKPEDKAADGQPAGEGTEEQHPAGEEEHPELQVVVPALTDGEEELHIELDDPAVASRLNEIVGQAATIERRESAVLDAYQEIDDVRDSIVADPVGFALGLVKSDPEAVKHLVLGLMTDPAVWPQLEGTVKKLAADPNEFRIVAAEQKGARADYRSTAQTRIAEQRAVRENFSQIQSAVAAMIPEDVDGARANEMFGTMLSKIKEHADRHNLLTFPIESIGPLLTPTLAAFGIEPIEAVQRAAKAAMKRSLPRRPNQAPFTATRPSSTNGNGSGNGRPAPKKPDGQAFKQSDERRRAAAAPGAGAGSPSAPNDLIPPRKADGSAMSTEETIAWHRGRLKVRGNALRSG